jgi:hypothetical protein
MDTPLPPVPADLWPEVIALSAKRPKGRMLTLEIPCFSENLLLTVLCRAIHHEMRWAGEWTARIGQNPKREFPSEQDFARHSAENAARLLAIYTAIYRNGEFPPMSDPNPEDLKAGATRSYQIALRNEREQQQRLDGLPLSPPRVLPHTLSTTESKPAHELPPKNNHPLR